MLFLSLLILLTGCLSKKCELKITEYNYDKESFELSITITLDDKLKDKEITKYGLIYEFTSCDKISKLTLDKEDLYTTVLEVKDLDLSNNTVTFVISDVNKYIRVTTVSARPYAIEKVNNSEVNLLSSYYKVMVISDKTDPIHSEPNVEDPIIKDVHIIMNFNGSYSVRTEDKRYVVRYQTTKNYDYLYIYITANDGYTFDENVNITYVEENGKNIGKTSYKLTNNNKEIEFKMRDPLWTGIY